uniref:Immunoevasive protein-2 n=1 Tax=Cotesia kariyai TaxID=178385 RepID=Q8WTN7_COTKA|nr:immunoevasive protein-2 [Cotesia kariyai]
MICSDGNKMYTYIIILLLAAGLSVLSISAENAVVCETGKFLDSGECVTYATNPGDSCGKSFLQCERIRNTYCHENKTCSCRYGFRLMNYTCIPGFGSQCNESNSLDKCTMANSVCDKNICKCQSGYIQIMDQCLKLATDLNNDCAYDDQCSKENTHCFGGKCQCKPGFYQKGKTCSAGLYSPCETKENTCTGTNQKCSKNFCMCDDDFYAHNGNCEPVQKGFNETCNHHLACKIENTICLNNRCQCIFQYTWNDGKCISATTTTTTTKKPGR